MLLTLGPFRAGVAFPHRAGRHHAEIKLFSIEELSIVHRAAGGFHAGLNTHFIVHQLGEATGPDKIGATRRGRTDRDSLGPARFDLGMRHGEHQARGEGENGQHSNKTFHHDTSSLMVTG